MSARISILGAGGWGTALAIHLTKNKHQVTLWEYREEAAERLRKTRDNKEFLPGIKISENITITSSLDETIDTDILLVTLPSHVVRSALESLAKKKINALVVSASKGIENHSLRRISEVIMETIPSVSANRVVVLSGPSHAEEVAIGIPTALTAASASESAALRIQEIFMSPEMRVYTSKDVIGVELGGALKNIIAIAAGIIDGVGFGDNTKAALMTRGLAEISRLGIALGADAHTFAGLAGLGDLIVTCTSGHSRNRFVGEEIGRGRSLHQILDEMTMVAEGVRTTQSAVDLAAKIQVEVPIIQAVYEVLFQDKNPKEAITELMTRTPKAEDFG